jgi:hypothetical protein
MLSILKYPYERMKIHKIIRDAYNISIHEFFITKTKLNEYF